MSTHKDSTTLSPVERVRVTSSRDQDNDTNFFSTNRGGSTNLPYFPPPPTSPFVESMPVVDDHQEEGAFTLLPELP